MRCILIALLAVIASPCLATEVNNPTNTAPATCSETAQLSFPGAMALLTVPSRQQLLDTGQKTIEIAAAMDTYVVCLNSAFAAFLAGRHFAEPVSLAVGNAVSNIIAEIARETRAAVHIYNLGVYTYDSSLPPGSSDAIQPLDISLDLPPPDARISLPQGTANQFSLPPRALGLPHNCAGFYPAKSLRAGQGGQILVGYDVAIDGSFVNIHVAKTGGTPELDDAALACVSTWRSTPAIIDGVPSPSLNHQAVVAFYFHS